ncbi:MAG: amidohydrolase [Mucilaginibacter sp.]|uniref:amidohydrolase n=1 Tax=Mucilaginibacter sp. TaxID=1882438 RepID=UPI0034E546BF
MATSAKPFTKFIGIKTVWCLMLLLSVFSCNQKKENNADLLVKNARVYTIDNRFAIAEAFAVRDGKILEVGKTADLEKKYTAKEVVDAHGKAVFPGFIDAHTHFYEYGMGLQTVNLKDLPSWNVAVDSVKSYAKNNTEGWIIGNGWDQNRWKTKQFPNKLKLDSLFPERPVVLTRVDGHAAIANQAALNIAGIKPNQKVAGGAIETIKGKLTGILLDNAVDLVAHKIPEPTEEQSQNALLQAQRNCFAVGLTTVDDCGLDFPLVNTIRQLQNRGDLKMRLFVMLSDNPRNLDALFRNGAIKTPRLNVSSVKVYADGALGSRGACLLKPYSDQPKWNGFLRSPQKHFQEIAELLEKKGFQMCTHAIGDSANRVMLKIYASVLKGKNDRRWRIEHSQIIDPADFKYFGENNIVPSVQPTHATSDMSWAVQRLGKTRLKTAYAYQQLLQQNGWLPLGTDFPVENISPFYTFYAAVERKDLKGLPEGGFQKENALTRQQAIKGMTIWAAKANFQEHEKGSLEPGKFADFVILDEDLMTVKGSELPKVKVLQTYINGENVYKKP